ncbi:hypothetical protein Hanom_Chr10g00910111 [Helianthus anomalus]
MEFHTPEVVTSSKSSPSRHKSLSCLFSSMWTLSIWLRTGKKSLHATGQDHTPLA